MLYEKNKLKNISFPLGGIGTGCIGLAGNGQLNDWEIFNRPNKNTRNGYSHFAIKARTAQKISAKVLHGDTLENLIGTHTEGMHNGYGYGPRTNSLAGFPHFRSVKFDACFPFAKLTFADGDFPAQIKLCAFNPFIPQDSFNSSLPTALFEWEIENLANEQVEYTLAFSVCNPSASSVNSMLSGQEKGVFFSCSSDVESTEYFDMSIVTDSDNAVCQPYWYRGAWFDGITSFWNNFTQDDTLIERQYNTAGQGDHGTVAVTKMIAPRQKAKIRFVFAWNAPLCYNYWDRCLDNNGKDVTWKNFYATQFENSEQTARYVMRRFDELSKKSDDFSRVLYGSSLPESAIDAVASNLSVLKSPTVFRLEDGSFWGWEGVQEREGSCEGSCQHVYNYAYALPFLFPDLERTLRENTVKYAMNEHGQTQFRVPLPLGRDFTFWRACLDGQMGEVIKWYREWKISGDDEWIRRFAPAVFKMLDFAFSPYNTDKWDYDCDGVLEGRQHQTLDVELFGPSSWLEGFYLLALDCGSKIARFLGEEERAKKYDQLYENGKKWTNENLFNGQYFIQKIDLTDKSIVDVYPESDKNYYFNYETGEIKYQVGEGSIIDQMIADWHANILGLGTVFDKDKKDIALRSMYKYNFVQSMRTVANKWRNFSLNDESGTIICAYPDGVQKPKIPITYCEETMTGFEYSLAGLMISEGMVSEGERMVKAVRDRFDGENRNPFNEFECGSNYVRSMSSFALLPIYSGMSFDMSKKYLGFAPIKGEGKFLWSVASSWGEVQIDEKSCALSVLGEPLTISSFGCKIIPSKVLLDGKETAFTYSDGKIIFDNLKVIKTLLVEA